jgi:hypothetical protein
MESFVGAFKQVLAAWFKLSERNLPPHRSLTMNKRFLRLLLVSAAFCVALSSSKADRPARRSVDGGEFTKEEQALLNKNQTMEMYKPDEHSRHFVAHIDSVADPKTGEKRKISKDAQGVLCFVFGMEDAQPAREQGRSMAECHYSSEQAHEFLFAQGWDKYHDRFFTRCYVQEGEAAYEAAAKAQQKPADQSSTS